RLLQPVRVHVPLAETRKLPGQYLFVGIPANGAHIRAIGRHATDEGGATADTGRDLDLVRVPGADHAETIVELGLRFGGLLLELRRTRTAAADERAFPFDVFGG